MSIAIGWPQGIQIAMFLFSISLHIARHGQYRKPEKYDVFVMVPAVLIQVALLYWGGFFG